MGIDEVSEKKGHPRLTLVTDINRRRMIWVGRGRDRKVLRDFFQRFRKKPARSSES
jgi:transposase